MDVKLESSLLCGLPLSSPHHPPECGMHPDLLMQLGMHEPPKLSAPRIFSVVSIKLSFGFNENNSVLHRSQLVEIYFCVQSITCNSFTFADSKQPR